MYNEISEQKTDKPTKQVELHHILDSLPKWIDVILSVFPGTYLGGGALRAAFDRTVVSDYDLFFKNEKVRDEVKDFLGTNHVIFQCPEGKLTSYNYFGIKIQLISPRYFEKCEDLLDHFDINACRMVLHNDFGWIFEAPELSRADATNRRITLHKVRYPISTLKRIQKYQTKGYSISDEAWLDLLSQIRTMPDDWFYSPESRQVYID